MKKRDQIPAAVPCSPQLQRKVLARGHAMTKQATAVPADAWLDRLVHRSRAFEGKVAQELAAINVAQDIAAGKSRTPARPKTQKPAGARSPAYTQAAMHPR